MNFREGIILRIASLVETALVIPDVNTQSAADGVTFLMPNTGYVTPIRKVLTEPIETIPEEKSIPRIYVSFDGGRNDLGAQVLITHLVEVLSIRVDVVLSKKHGIEEHGGNQIVRPITLQIADTLSDLQKIITVDSVKTAVTNPTAQLNNLYFGEWTLDERFRGGQEEVLNIRLDLEVENPLEAS